MAEVGRGANSMSVELSEHHFPETPEPATSVEDSSFANVPALIGRIHNSGASVQGRITIRQTGSETEVVHEIAYETRKSTLARFLERISVKFHLILEIRASLKNLLA